MADTIRYHATREMLNQVIGADIVALFLVAPMSIVAGAGRATAPTTT